MGGQDPEGVSSMTEETFQEQIERLELMAAGDPQWDLSDNDRAAIRVLLEKFRACVNAQEYEPNG